MSGQRPVNEKEREDNLEEKASGAIERKGPWKHGLYSGPKFKTKRNRPLRNHIRKKTLSLAEIRGGIAALSGAELTFLNTILIPQWLALESFNNHCLERDFQPTDSVMAFWVSLTNSFARHCQVWGFSKKEANPLTLEQYLKSREEKAKPSKRVIVKVGQDEAGQGDEPQAKTDSGEES